MGRRKREQENEGNDESYEDSVGEDLEDDGVLEVVTDDITVRGFNFDRDPYGDDDFTHEVGCPGGRECVCSDP